MTRHLRSGLDVDDTVAIRVAFAEFIEAQLGVIPRFED